MKEEYTLDNLNQYGVSVKKQMHMEHEGIEYPVGELWRRAYVNSEQGRQQIVEELPQEQVNAITAVWGEAVSTTE